LKGISAISHDQAFYPIQTMGSYQEIPPFLLDLVASFGSEKVKSYANARAPLSYTPVKEVTSMGIGDSKGGQLLVIWAWENGTC